MAADDRDGVVHGGAFIVGELGHVTFDSADQPPDAGDLFLGRGRVRASPLIDSFDRGGQAFAGAQQVVEVAGEVGQVGHVGAEMVTAGAAEPDRAGAAAGLHVGRLTAGPVRNSDRTDLIPGVLAV